MGTAYGIEALLRDRFGGRGGGVEFDIMCFCDL
jgi:hypothetical protein